MAGSQTPASASSFVGVLSGTLDEIFWKRFADEYRQNPNSPTAACFSGMFQVGLIFYVALLGLLTPVLRGMVIAANAVAGRPILAGVNKTAWFIVLALSAALTSAYLVRRRYWRYRAKSEMAVAYGEKIDRMMIAIKMVGLLACAFIIMAVMMTLFWLR